MHALWEKLKTTASPKTPYKYSHQNMSTLIAAVSANIINRFSIGLFLFIFLLLPGIKVYIHVHGREGFKKYKSPFGDLGQVKTIDIVSNI